MDSNVFVSGEENPNNMSTDTPTRDDLLARARAMVPTLIERAPKCEEMRRLPDETYEDFKQAGFFKIGLPKKYGGYEMDYDVLCEVITKATDFKAAVGVMEHIVREFAVKTVRISRTGPE